MRILILLALFHSFILSAGFPKEYYKIKDSKKKKQYFFDYLYPIIQKANMQILEDRVFIKHYQDSYATKDERRRKEEILKKYKIKNQKEALKKIDIIPPSLALAQAAIESGWGNSRFTKIANNIFGQWTYKGKGIVPLQRAKGKKHLIKVFDSFDGAIVGYMYNLNMGHAYNDFREKRTNARNSGLCPNGVELSSTMIKYSGIGGKYLSLIKKIISQNHLSKYDKIFFTKGRHFSKKVALVSPSTQAVQSKFTN